MNKDKNFQVDLKEVLVRIIKYIIEGVIVAVAAFLIPGKKIAVSEIVTIGILAACTFSVLDFAAPSIGASARSGAGAGIGLGLTGGLPTSSVGASFR